MKYFTILLLSFVGAVKSYGYPAIALLFFSMIRNKLPNLKGYMLLADQMRQMEEANQELTRLNALKDRMLSIISHDTRAPLDSLKSLLRLLVNNNLTQNELQSVISNLDNQVGQLSNFLENLLRWTKNHFEQIRLHAGKLSLLNLVRENIELFLLNARRKQIVIQVDVSEKIMIYADEEMIKLVLRNLISNAIKFCHANDSIYINATHEQGMIRVSVKDTGRGMSEEHMSNLFELSHLSTKGTKDEIGIGLGLTLCREFVEKAGGKISATSELGKGSCFEFTVPRFPEVASFDFSPSNYSARS